MNWEGIKSGWKFIQEIIFPIFCVDCGKEKIWWCDSCQEKKPATNVSLCPVCHLSSLRGEVCARCRPSSFLNGAMALYSYENSAVAKLIKNFKYNFIEEIQVVWQEVLNKNFIIKQWVNWSLDEEVIFVPVPLHPRRYRERGFNQAAYLAKAWQKIFFAQGGKSSYDNNLLIRAIYTNPQARLSGEKRKNSLKNAFALKNQTIVPHRVILIDDVFTTGATMQECARVLKDGGVKEVWGWAIARG